MTTPAFLIAIDTEEDNLWFSPRSRTTENAGWLPRFQALCERFGLKPAYLANYCYKTFTSPKKRGLRICPAYYGHIRRLLQQEG